MTWLHSGPLLLLIPLCFAGGLVVGVGYFRALRLTTDLIVGGGSPLPALVLTAGRLAVLGAGLFLAVLAGGPTLLAALARILAAKALTVRDARRISA